MKRSNPMLSQRAVKPIGTAALTGVSLHNPFGKALQQSIQPLPGTRFSGGVRNKLTKCKQHLLTPFLDILAGESGAEPARPVGEGFTIEGLFLRVVPLGDQRWV